MNDNDKWYEIKTGDMTLRFTFEFPFGIIKSYLLVDGKKIELNSDRLRRLRYFGKRLELFKNINDRNYGDILPYPSPSNVEDFVKSAITEVKNG